MEWPGRCSECREQIDDWTDAGLYRGRWVHKACFSGRFSGQPSAHALEALRSPVERSSQLELPMIIFVLMFHFGLGAAVAGWIMLTQLTQDTSGGAFVLAVGIIVPVIGAIGMALNVISRRRIETIRQELEANGGWKPAR